MAGINFEVLTPPSQEQLSLSDVKLYVRVDYADEDPLLTQFISDAREYAQSLLRKSLCPQTIRATIEPDRMAQGALSGSVVGNDIDFTRNNERATAIPFAFYGPCFPLPMTPAVAMSLVEYQLTPYDVTIAPNNPNWTTLAATDSNGNPNYILDLNTTPSQLFIMPMLAASRFRFTYTAGYAIGACPSQITNAMKALISFWYDHRQGEGVPDDIQQKFIEKRVWML